MCLIKKMTGFQKFIKVVFTPIVKFFFRIRVYGMEHEPPANQGFMVCANHISASDPVMICAALKHNFPYYMAKKELFYIPLLNLLIRALGAFPVNRGTPDVKALRKAIEKLENGSVVGIFPQGHRNPGIEPEKTEPKGGAATIAIRAECDVLPVLIQTKHYRRIPFRRVNIVIGELIPAAVLHDAFEAEGREGVSRLIFTHVCDLQNQLPEKTGV